MMILSIGDIHGRDAWKFLTHGSSYEYNLWRTAVDAGAPADDYDFWKECPYTKFDKIIFVGDYVDSFTVKNVIIKQNLEDIIHFKKALGDKVVLLIGNHDVQYMVPNQICSGYRPEMRYDLEFLFTKNMDLFKMAHEEESESGEKWLWTHAGVTSGWYDKVLVKNMMNPKFRHHEIVNEFNPSSKKVSEVINFAWEMRMNSLYNVDSYSGGIDSWAGPLWVRPQIFNYWPLTGYNQVVGHTPQGDIWTVDSDPDGNSFDNFKHYFIDCLEYGSENGLITKL
jgi:hypothetical protein